jgi:hypothetical protein
MNALQPKGTRLVGLQPSLIDLAMWLLVMPTQRLQKRLWAGKLS